TRRQVRFTVTITPGGPGTASMSMSFSGRDFSMQCQDTVQTGLITFGPLDSSVLSQIESVQPTILPELRQGLQTLRQLAQGPQVKPVVAGSAA
ncbi:MAG TPA: hypothetical protein VKU60_00565, partial [Chloroflexota bacterium]|nr:hypothetical protein [Chloroflexota bacterium]